MDTQAGSGQHTAPAQRGPDGPRSATLGSLTIPGTPQHVASARTFIAQTLSRVAGIDSDAATLLTSELVTNAIQHTKSGDGGQATVAVLGLPDGVLVEVSDQGSPGAPVVKSDLYTADGHGLYLVQQLAGKWGYLRASTGTTVWFYLPADRPLGTAAAEPGTAADGFPRQRPRPALS